tara:strand:+ start:3334 stop:5538 length:2205 start_codon:yes stop_codon:yes gene_type:complete
MNWNFFNKSSEEKTFEEKSVGDLESILRDQLRGTGSSRVIKKAIPIGTSYESMSKQGYMNAVAVYYCTTLISQKAGSVPVKLFKKAERKEDRTEIYSHPILDLIRNPNPVFDWENYVESFMSYFFLDGNVYERPIVVNGKVKEMVLYSPSEVGIETNKYDVATGYKVTHNGKVKIYPIKKLDLSSEVKHFKNFNPLDKNRGLSVLRSASTVIDIQNSGDAHNLNMLTNQARPSGALTYKPADGAPAQLDEEQFERLKEEMREQYSGSENTGRPLLLEGGLDWVQMSLNARDLDYLNSRGVSQKDVCRVYKVPAVLLGLDNDSTYNNVREARLGLWDDAITPVLNKVINHWNKHILPLFGEEANGLELVADYSGVSDLETRTERVWNRIDGADFITLNEKRNMINLDPIDGGNTIMISSGDIPLELLQMGIQAANLNEIVSAGVEANQASLDKPTKNPADKPKPKPVKSETKASDETLYNAIDALTVQFEKRLDRSLIPFMSDYGDLVEKAIIDNKEMGAAFALMQLSEKMAKEIAPIMTDVIETFGEMTLRDISKKSDGAFLYKEDVLVADVISSQEAQNILLSSAWTERVVQYVEREAVVRSKFVEDTNRKEVNRILVEGVKTGKSYEQIAKEANVLISDRARTMRIVRTEVHTAREFGSHEAAKMTGLEINKRWLSSFDERTRDSHVSANGQVVKLSAKFNVGGSRLDHPGDPSGSAKEVINCRCTSLHEPI